jgi:hypothetical protein
VDKQASGPSWNFREEKRRPLLLEGIEKGFLLCPALHLLLFGIKLRKNIRISLISSKGRVSACDIHH